MPGAQHSAPLAALGRESASHDEGPKGASRLTGLASG